MDNTTRDKDENNKTFPSGSPSVPDDESSEGALKHGQQAINAEKEFSETSEEGQADDAEKWRNEG